MNECCQTPFKETHLRESKFVSFPVWCFDDAETSTFDIHLSTIMFNALTAVG